MGVRNQHREAIERLESKTLDARFTTEIQQGLNCSPFEAEAVLDVVKEVYFPFLSSESPQAPPGKIALIAVAADEPAGKPVSHCKKQTVCLTLHQQFTACGFRPENTLVLISHFANSLRTMLSRIPYLTAWANGVTRHGTCFR